MIEERFDLKKAMSYLASEFCVRRADWPVTHYVYQSGDKLFDQDNDVVSWDIIKNFNRFKFELFMEEEECETMEESGIVEDGRPLNKLSGVESSEENTTVEINPLVEKKLENTTTKTKSIITEEIKNGERIIENEEMPQLENGTQKIESKTTEKLLPTDIKEIQPSDSKVLLLKLNEEKSASVTLLNNSATRLISLAEKMMPKEDDEIDTYKVDVAVKCLAESRAAMKTKLEYLKFAKDLL